MVNNHTIWPNYATLQTLQNYKENKERKKD